MPEEVTTPSPTPAIDSEFDDFIACIERADFDAVNLATAWNTGTTDCASCHTGAFGNDPQRFFDDLKTRMYVQLVFFNFDSGVVVNDHTIPRAGKAEGVMQAHPRFDSTAGMAALRALYDRTRARIISGSCP